VIVVEVSTPEESYPVTRTPGSSVATASRTPRSHTSLGRKKKRERRSRDVPEKKRDVPSDLFVLDFSRKLHGELANDQM
jgi:hypothetical protein